jgi:hypothetical protein
MKFFTQTLVTIICSFIVQYFLPWWTLAIVAFAVGYYFNNKGFISFAAGFIGVGVLWLTMAFYIDSSTQSILVSKVGKLFPVNIFVLMVIVGGLVGGFAGLTGTLLRGKKLARY